MYRGGAFSADGKLRGYEPTNCIRRDLVKWGAKDPYEVAREYMKGDLEHRCCTIGEDNSVQQWELPPDKTSVELKEAAENGITFYYCPNRLLGYKDFPAK